MIVFGPGAVETVIGVVIVSTGTDATPEPADMRSQSSSEVTDAASIEGATWGTVSGAFYLLNVLL